MDELSPILDIVAALYDTASDATAWDEFAPRLCESVAADGVMAVEFDLGARAVLGWRISGYDECLAAQYSGRYLPEDPRMPFFLRNIGRPVCGGHAAHPDSLRRSAVFNDLLRPFRAEEAMIMSARTAGDRAVFLGLLRDSRRGEFGMDELRLLALLQPHFERAQRLAASLADAERRDAAKTDVLDRLSVGIILVDTAGTLVHANAQGRAALVAGDGLRLTRAHVTACSGMAARMLERAVGAAQRVARGEELSAGGVVAIPRPDGKPPLTVQCAPLRVGGSPARGAATVALVVSDPLAEVTASEVALRAAFGLTPAESRLARELVRGRSLREIADEGTVSYHTLRDQLKALLHKTDTHRQADLVRRLMLTLAMVRA